MQRAREALDGLDLEGGLDDFAATYGGVGMVCFCEMGRCRVAENVGLRDHQKKKVKMRSTIIAGRPSVRTMPATLLQAMTWKRKVLSAQITMENPKRGRDPERAVPILVLRRFTSSGPECFVWCGQSVG